MKKRNPNSIILHEEGYWVISRDRAFGPFDYQWSADLRGIQFTFRGETFGEFCSPHEFFADLKPFGLPLTVCRIAAIVSGSIVNGIQSGSDQTHRAEDLAKLLRQFGFDQFEIYQSTQSED
jgi:hypothetical protein